MFEPSCGRKPQNPVWRYFEYDKSTDKSRCKVGSDSATTMDSSAEHEPASGSEKQRSCGQELIGKNTTNLKSHLRSKHEEVYDRVVAEESVKKESLDDRPSQTA
jgi:BED zinc finger